MLKDLAVPLILATGIVGGSLYGFYRYSLYEDGQAAARRTPAAAPPQRELTRIDPCPGGKMLQGECHVRKPDAPNLWIRKSDLERPKAVAPTTMNVAVGGITANERQRMAEFEQQQRADAAARDQLIAQQVAELDRDQAQCKLIEQDIKRIDSITRQPLSGSEQDYWRGRRRELRDRQAHLRC